MDILLSFPGLKYLFLRQDYIPQGDSVRIEEGNRESSGSSTCSPAHPEYGILDPFDEL
jgi:hypothetical protein